jgi:hypothetical protein
VILPCDGHPDNFRVLADDPAQAEERGFPVVSLKDFEDTLDVVSGGVNPRKDGGGIWQ